MFNKSETKKITYESGGYKTMVDYILVRESDRAKLKDVKVIPGVACIPQHRLLVSVAHLGSVGQNQIAIRFKSRFRQ